MQTPRQALYELVKQGLTSVALPDNVYQRSTKNTIEDQFFVLIEWGETNPRTGVDVEVWVYDREPNYLRIDLALQGIKRRLKDVENYVGSDGSIVSAIHFDSYGSDMYSEDLKANSKYALFSVATQGN